MAPVRKIRTTHRRSRLEQRQSTAPALPSFIPGLTYSSATYCLCSSCRRLTRHEELRRQTGVLPQAAAAPAAAGDEGLACGGYAGPWQEAPWLLLRSLASPAGQARLRNKVRPGVLEQESRSNVVATGLCGRQ